MTGSRDFLAVDLGAESGRVVLGSLQDDRLAVSVLHRFPNGPVRLPDGLHWDVLRLWSEIKAGLAFAVRQRGRRVVSAGVDTWGVDCALLDKTGALIGNPYHYRDGRTDGIMPRAFRRVPREQIFEQTGIQFMEFNTLYQLLAMVEGASPALASAHTLLTIPDLLNYWLSGVQVCEFTNATTTQCYDPRRRTWADPLLVAMGIPRAIFPEIVAPGTRLGPLAPEVAAEVGAALDIVAPACHDTGSAVASVPAEGSEFAWISSGTWSIMGAEVREPVINAASLAANFTNEGGVAGTFRFSKNIAGLWLVQECRRTWAAQGEEMSYADLADLAAEAEPFVSIVDPDHPDFAKVGDMPARLAAYCQRTGQPVPQTKGAVVRCALESLALKYRWVLTHLEQITGHHFNALHIVGGGMQNRLLSQLTADATCRTVVAGPVEATAIGNVLMQAIALGEVASLAEARELVRRSFVPEMFEPSITSGCDQAYRRLTALMGS